MEMNPTLNRNSHLAALGWSSEDILMKIEDLTIDPATIGEQRMISHDLYVVPTAVYYREGGFGGSKLLIVEVLQSDLDREGYSKEEFIEKVNNIMLSDSEVVVRP